MFARATRRSRRAQCSDNEGVEMGRLAIAGVAVAVLLLVNSAVAAASGWSIEPTPNPSGAANSYLHDVSCASARACAAVGYYDNGATLVALAERWNGTTWSIEHTPKPTGASFSVLGGVSCASASACTGVGYYDNGTPGGTLADSVTLAERWNGTRWSVEHTPNPTGGSQSQLIGVSCTSASDCTAVGSYNNGNIYVVLAERWNGTKWSIEHAPNPTGASQSQLYGVSCTSASACTAVGSYTNATTGVTLAERWNGTKWSIEHTPNPTGGSNSELSDVSCTSASACIAVGYYSNGNLTTDVTLAERWNGTRWSIEPTPNPTGATYSYLYGVWCASASACTAVGSDSNGGTTNVTLVEHWNGTRWSIEPTPSPTGGSNSELYGVSCASARDCTAVGDYANGTPQVTLAEHWNGTA